MVNTRFHGGYDIVVEIRPESYEITTTGDGVGYSFEMDDDTHAALAGAVKRALDRPKTVEQLEIKPGYIRVKIHPEKDSRGRADEVTPTDLIMQLARVERIYNDHEASSPDRDGISLGAKYIGVYVPDGVTSPEDIIDMSDGPLVSVDVGEGRDQPAGGDDRHIAYEYVLPFKEKMYSSESVTQTPFEWDVFAQDYFETTVETAFRHRPGDRQIDVYEKGIHIVHLVGSKNISPSRLGGREMAGISEFNSVHPLRQKPGPGQKGTRQSPLSLGSPVHIMGNPDKDDGVSGFIQRNGLDEQDGSPINPPKTDLASEVETEESGSPWDKLNPFGGA